jgi:hypothetical protein
LTSQNTQPILLKKRAKKETFRGKGRGIFKGEGGRGIESRNNQHETERLQEGGMVSSEMEVDIEMSDEINTTESMNTEGSTTAHNEKDNLLIDFWECAEFELELKLSHEIARLILALSHKNSNSGLKPTHSNAPMESYSLQGPDLSDWMYSLVNESFLSYCGRGIHSSPLSSSF